MLVLGREHEVKDLTSLADFQYRFFAFILYLIRAAHHAVCSLAGFT